jgi:ribosomal protein S18 acetylase RimI-like enzyme
VLDLLRGTHWGAELSVPLMTRAIANSVAFGLYAGSELVGFGRVVTDLATYGYLTDVVVAEPHRGQGLGRWLTECILAHPELQGFRRLALVTRDAQALYVSLGFQVGAGERTYLERR